jgi:hypothetical protein
MCTELLAPVGYPIAVKYIIYISVKTHPFLSKIISLSVHLAMRFHVITNGEKIKCNTFSSPLQLEASK